MNINSSKDVTGHVDVAVTLRAYIDLVLGLNLGQYTDHPA
jgi:hypothetical protein